MLRSLTFQLLVAWYGSFQPLPPPKGALLTLAKGRCYGTCPAFELTIFENGRVEYEGKFSVRDLGRREARIAPEQVAMLRAALNQIHFDALKEEYHTGTTDVPATAVCRGGHHPHCVTYEPGWETSGPKELVDLVAQIEELTGATTWITSVENYRYRVMSLIGQLGGVESTPWGHLDRCAAALVRPSSYTLELPLAIEFELTIDSAGKVVATSVQKDTLANRGAESCMMQEIATWNFPPPPVGQDPVKVDFTWVLSPNAKR